MKVYSSGHIELDNGDIGVFQNGRLLKSLPPGGAEVILSMPDSDLRRLYELTKRRKRIMIRIEASNDPAKRQELRVKQTARKRGRGL